MPAFTEERISGHSKLVVYEESDLLGNDSGRFMDIYMNGIIRTLRLRLWLSMRLTD